VSHLVGHVLSASQSCGVDTNLGEEELSSSKEVTEGLVVDDLLRDGIADSHLGEISLALHLNVLGQQSQLDVLDLVETGMSLVKGVNVVLDLGHGELSVDQLVQWRERSETHRTRKRPCFGAISFRNDLPIWAEAKGTRPLLNSRSLAKLTK